MNHYGQSIRIIYYNIFIFNCKLNPLLDICVKRLVKVLEDKSGQSVEVSG